MNLTAFRSLTTLSLSALLLAFAATTDLSAQTFPEPESEEEGLERYEQIVEESYRRDASDRASIAGAAAAKGSGEYGGLMEDPTGRHEWFMFQRSFPYPYLPAGIRQQAIRFTEKLKGQIADAEARTRFSDDKELATARADNPTWRNIGPFNVAGRLRALLVHPSKPSTIFVGAASGGVWKNEGDPDSWVSNFDKQTGLAIGSMAFHPTNPDIIYVGTGEVINSHISTFNATPAYFGDGMFRTTDGGETWENIGLNFLGTISAIYVRKDNPQIIYAASAQGGGGLYRSTDGGETWSQLRGITGTLFNIEVDPTDEDYMLVSGSAAISWSDDGGQTFTRATGYSPSAGVRTEIALAPSDPATVYALVARLSGSASDTRNFAEFHISTDRGKSWTLKNAFGGDSRSFFNSQGHYNNCIAVHPTKPEVVLVGGIDIYRTGNGGTTFSNTTLSYQGGDVHPDQHVIAFDPQNPSRVYIGNDGGAYLSQDEGRNWIRISESLPVTQYYEIGIDQSRPFRVYGGTQDNGTQGAFGQNDWARDWPQINGGDGFHVVVDPEIPDFVYAESQYGVLRRIDVRNFSSRYLTRDMDRSTSSDFDRGSWSTPIAISEINGALYTGRGSLWQSFNRGSNWIRLRPGNVANISAIGLGAHDETGGDILIGTTVGELRRTIDGGENWLAADETNEVPGRYISEIVYDPVDSDRVYVVASGVGARQSVFRSDDRGATFVNITNNLPNVPHSAFAVDPNNNNILFTGNDIGVFVSLDGGQIWLPFDEGLPYVPIVDLEIHRSRNTLIAGTHGRSMFEIEITSPQPVPVLLAPLGGTIYETDDTIEIRWAGFGEPVRVMISYDGGATYDTIGVFSSGTAATAIAPFLQTNSGIVRVENLSGDRVTVSDPFSVTPQVNTDGRGARGFTAGAIAIRENNMWCADREEARMVLLRLPALLPSGNTVEHSLDPSRIVDLAYDETRDRFVVLLADTNDYSGAELYFMAPDGTTGDAISVPSSSLAGVTVSPEGIVVVEPGTNGRLHILDPDDGSLIRSTDPLQNALGASRRAIAWDGGAYAQSVDDAAPGASLPDALDRIALGTPPTVTQSTPLVVEDQATIDLFGLAFYESDAETGIGVYYVTSRSGQFYIVESRQVSSVRNFATYTGSFSLSRLTPNPVTDRASLGYRTSRTMTVDVAVFTTNGERVSTIDDLRIEAGQGSIDLSFAGLPSGLYRVVVTAPDGTSDATTAVVAR